MNSRTTADWIDARGLALALALCALLFFTELGALGLVGPDEPRYAEVAREITTGHDWVTPRLYGSPWFEKPMLYYWLAALAYRLGGVNETMARLPSALAAALTALAFAAVARKLFDQTTAQLTFLFLASSIGWLGFARAASFDMLFSACLGLALIGLLLIETAEEETIRRRAAYGFHIALGLAVLAKGPAAIVLAGGTTLIYAVLARRRALLASLLRPGPLGAFLLVAAPWHVAVIRANGWAFVQTYLFAHNIERFLTPIFRHEQGPWFFLVVLPLAIFPWTLLLGLPLLRWWRERGLASRRPSVELLLAAWIAVPLIFFTLSRSKLPGYILPAVPALCMLLARSVAQEGTTLHRRWFLLAATASAVLAVAASPWILTAIRLPIAEAHAFRVEIVAALVALGAISWFAWKDRPVAWALAITLLIAAAVNVTLGFLGEEINRSASARPSAQRIQAAAPVGKVPIYTYKVSRQMIYGLNFYLAISLTDADTTTILEPTALVVLPESTLAEAQEHLGRRLEPVTRLEGNLVLVRATMVPRSEEPSGRK